MKAVISKITIAMLMYIIMSKMAIAKDIFEDVKEDIETLQEWVLIIVIALSLLYLLRYLFKNDK